MRVSPRKGAKPATSRPHPSTPPLSSSGETAAVRLYDLDAVFLSKTVVSLADVFAHSVNGPFDVSPLHAPRQQGAAQQQQQQKLQPAAVTVASLPYTDDSYPSRSTSGAPPVHMRAANLPFSGGSAPYTSLSPKLAAWRASTRAAALRPKTVVRGADGRWRAVSPDRGASAISSTTTACSKPTSQGAGAQIRLVPLDSYHFLLTYRDVDLSGQLCSSCDQRAATATVERLSAASPGCRPPRSGICVVRRLEGEQRDATSASPSPKAASTGAAPTTYPTLSRIAHGLPLEAFDGWVRDYTVYGLSCNEAVLHAAWRDKTRERTEGAFATPAGAVVEVGESTAAVHEAAGGGSSGEARPISGRGDHRCEGVGGVDIDGSRECSSGDVKVDEAATEEGEDGTTFVPADAGQGTRVSPSLDRLHCSSTTTSSLTETSTPSPSTERYKDGSVGVATRVARKEGSGVPESAPASLTSAAAQGHQQKFLLWEEEQQRAKRASAQLRHRFLVSDSAQHAIWALEVRLPAMEVRAVSPAEFYTPEAWESTEEVPTSPRHDEEGDSDVGNDASAECCAAKTRVEPTAAPPPGLLFPRKKPASTITHGHAAASSHLGSVKICPGASAPGQRSPSPADPSTTANVVAPDNPGDSRPHGGASCSTQRCSRSVSSVSPSLAMAEAMPTPLMGGARGFVDGHFSVARFRSPGALCWRIDEDDDDDKRYIAGGGSDSDDDAEYGVFTGSHESRGRGWVPTKRPRVEPMSHLRRRRRCTVLFISDMGNCAIRYANFQNRLVRTITGVDGVPGYRDGSCVSSLLRGATALAWCSAGLLFTDGANNVLRLITGIRKRRTQEHEHNSGEDAIGAGTGAPSARCATGTSVAEMQTLNEPEVHLQTSTATEQPRYVGDKPTDQSLSSPPATALESEGGAPQAPPPAPSSSSPPSATPQGMLPSSSCKGDGPAIVMPRVWTLAGCARSTDGDQCTGADASLGSYIDCAVPSRARFGYISDMALWTDETGDTQVLLVDQTHHALRILDAHGGVSTYVGPVDYEVSSMTLPSTTSTPVVDSLPPGLVFPCCLTVGALIKERSPVLLSAATAAAATMITPQPYLCSSSPLLFTASAITGTVSVLLPTSQRSVRTPWNVLESQLRHRAAEDREAEEEARNGDDDGASVFAAIRGALELGVATEGRRIIGEVTTPSLRHVVVGWAADEADGGQAGSAHAARRRLRTESAQQALQYLRLRFPWLLPPPVPPLSTRLVAGCSCHVSGKRRGTAAAGPAPAGEAVGLHVRTESSSKGVGVPPVCAGGKPGTVPATSTAAVRAVQERLLFQSPPRCPPITAHRSTSAIAHAPAAAAVEEVAALWFKPTLLSATPPRMVEVLHDTHLGDDVAGDGAAASNQREPCAGRSSPSCATLPLSSDGNPKINADKDGSRHSSSGSSQQQLEDGEDEQKAHGSDVGGGRAAAKWLAPPLKSVSRSPSGNSCRGQQPQPPVGLAAHPSEEPSLTYAGRFQEWTPEQRQQRLRSTLEIPIPTGSVNTSPSGTPRAPHQQQQQEEGNGSPSHGHQSEDGRLSSRSPEQLLLLQALSSPISSSHSPRRRTTSPSNLSGRGSPPLTPRAMAAHQLMHRRRTSRSSTAPHMPSTEGGARGSTERQSATFAAGRDSITPQPQTQQQDGSQGRAARAEPQAVSVSPDRGNLQPCRADQQLHRAYDAAVRRLFRVYHYLAAKIVTTTATASAAPVAAGATGRSGGADPRIAAVRSRRGSAPSPRAMRQPREVEQYTMSFTAFFRFLVLTGYADYLAEVAVAAVAATAADAQGKDGADPRTVGRAHSVPSPTSLLCRLSQVQRRQSGSSSGGVGATAAGTSSLFSRTRPPTCSDVRVVPLAATDARAIAAVLYDCGVRRKGYHTVTQMDFQSFRRAVLLLYTWARTASCAETAKKSDTAGHDSVQGTQCSTRRNAGRRSGADAAAFAYVDTVPSLDALTSEEVVAAYVTVYEHAVRCIPALAMSFGSEGIKQAGENHPVAEGCDSMRQRSDVRRHDRPVSSMRALARAPSPLLAVNADSSGATPPCLRALEESMGPSQRGGGFGGPAAGVDDVITPPVSPIATTGAVDDVSCLAIDGGDPVKVREAVPREAASAAQSSKDADAFSPPRGLTPHETVALDELLRLLQRNESTLRQLFEAYSVPITVHRSPQYEAPLPAALAAASSACSLPSSSPEASLVLGDGGRAAARQPRHASASSLVSMRVDVSPATDYPSVVPRRNHPAAGIACPTRSAMPAAAAAATAALDTVHDAAVLSSVPTSQHDLSWKVQQLYTMSALENKEAYERTSHVLHVVTFKLFVELWRTLDVFPSLMRMGAMQQAFCDALTTPMLRGLTLAPRKGADALPRPQEQPPAPSLPPSAPLPNRRIVEQLCRHGGLPYACFIESFVRVALTVFSHKVDRIAYPTATAKTAGLMQWCNKQVTLGLAGKRVQQQLSVTVTGAHASSMRLSMTPTGAVSASTVAARAPRAVGVFPHQLRLFCVPSVSRPRAASPKTG
ncbi:hypothetical protein LSCM4_07267 [Leishmania orientalis]|uniref:Uncharacterized protein n=1 Tax=Leishmania orientalis TaxID=2249476 RepID=A0A836KYY5_9TRYP|nr:hypothetical protein LSCM4_07267 [Leishmania orientalis]